MQHTINAAGNWIDSCAHALVYECGVIPWRWIISVTSAVYSRNNTGPRTLPLEMRKQLLTLLNIYLRWRKITRATRPWVPYKWRQICRNCSFWIIRFFKTKILLKFLALSHFASSHCFKFVNLQSTSRSNSTKVAPCIFCAISNRLTDNNVSIIVPSKSRSRSRNTIFGMTAFDSKYQNL